MGGAAMPRTLIQSRGAFGLEFGSGRPKLFARLAASLLPSIRWPAAWWAARMYWMKRKRRRAVVPCTGQTHRAAMAAFDRGGVEELRRFVLELMR
jgi:hypothetical protein